MAVYDAEMRAWRKHRRALARRRAEG